MSKETKDEDSAEIGLPGILVVLFIIFIIEMVKYNATGKFVVCAFSRYSSTDCVLAAPRDFILVVGGITALVLGIRSIITAYDRTDD